MGETKVEVQNRRRRTLTWALKGKQIFDNNGGENSLERAYAKVQKHRTHKNGNNKELHWDKEYGQVLQVLMMETVHASS